MVTNLVFAIGFGLYFYWLGFYFEHELKTNKDAILFRNGWLNGMALAFFIVAWSLAT